MRSIFVGFVLFVLTAVSYAELPANYEQLTADQKQSILWDQIVSSNAQKPLPPLNTNSFSSVWAQLTGLFNLSPTFDYTSDELPKGRVKILHPNGSVGKIVFVPDTNHPFTGLYQSGAIGLARLSLGTTPSDTSFIPGIAIKFLLPNHASLNLHAIYSLEGQGGNWNFFENSFSNKIARPTQWILKAIEQIFEWTHSPSNKLPVWHLASFNNLGEAIEQPISPTRIYFRPSESVRGLIPADSRDDFRVSLARIPFGPMYEMYGVYENEEYHIGTLMLESTLLPSEYGDKHLFFQHRR